MAANKEPEQWKKVDSERITQGEIRSSLLILKPSINCTFMQRLWIRK